MRRDGRSGWRLTVARASRPHMKPRAAPWAMKPSWRGRTSRGERRRGRPSTVVAATARLAWADLAAINGNRGSCGPSNSNDNAPEAPPRPMSFVGPTSQVLMIPRAGRLRAATLAGARVTSLRRPLRTGVGSASPLRASAGEPRGLWAAARSATPGHPPPAASRRRAIRAAARHRGTPPPRSARST